MYLPPDVLSLSILQEERRAPRVVQKQNGKLLKLRTPVEMIPRAVPIKPSNPLGFGQRDNLEMFKVRVRLVSDSRQDSTVMRGCICERATKSIDDTPIRDEYIDNRVFIGDLRFLMKTLVTEGRIWSSDIKSTSELGHETIIGIHIGEDQ